MGDQIALNSLHARPGIVEQRVTVTTLSSEIFLEESQSQKEEDDIEKDSHVRAITNP